MAMVTDMRDRWERMAPREQRLLMLLGLTAVVLVLIGTAAYVQRGLARLEEQNEAMRGAIELIENNRDEYLAQKSRRADPVTLIGANAPPLLTYLETISQEVGVQIPESREGEPDKRGKFVEKTMAVTLRGISLTELGSLLEKIETKSPIIVVQRLEVKTVYNQQDKLDAELTVATYETAKKEKKEPKKPAAEEDE